MLELNSDFLVGISNPMKDLFKSGGKSDNVLEKMRLRGHTLMAITMPTYFHICVYNSHGTRYKMKLRTSNHERKS